MKGNHVKMVWVGFCDDRPHRQGAGDKEPDYVVCSTKKLALAMYEDVRKAWLVWPVTPKRKKRRARSATKNS